MSIVPSQHESLPEPLPVFNYQCEVCGARKSTSELLSTEGERHASQRMMRICGASVGCNGRYQLVSASLA